jgi:hypothetical protein
MPRNEYASSFALPEATDRCENRSIPSFFTTISCWWSLKLAIKLIYEYTTHDSFLKRYPNPKKAMA